MNKFRRPVDTYPQCYIDQTPPKKKHICGGVASANHPNPQFFTTEVLVRQMQARRRKAKSLGITKMQTKEYYP